MIRGRRITPADVQSVQALLDEQPSLGRWRLALELCQRWQWRTAQGEWKGRAAVAVLAAMAERGWIQLPASSRSVTPGPVGGPRADGWSALVRHGPLSGCRPLVWERVQTAGQRQRWRQLLDGYHYLRAPGMVGANLKYLVYGPGGELLGALGWQSAVAHLGCRDRILGWNPAQKAHYLDRLVNNVRFLLLPWVQVPGLASVILQEGLGCLRRDWPQRYGRPVWWVESFVDRQRFEATSYQAAQWEAIGWTRGFAKCGEGFIEHGQNKEVYAWVVEPRMRRWIHGDESQPLLTRAFLQARRAREPLTKRMRLRQIIGSWKGAGLSHQGPGPAGAKMVQELRAFAALFQEAFARVESQQWFELHLQGLLSPGEAHVARRLDQAGQQRNLQRLLSDYQWDESWMAQRHWELAATSLSAPSGVWSLEVRRFPKGGQAGVGVGPQPGGGHGQSGVLISYASAQGQALLEGRLYLPPCWLEPEYAERRQAGRIPPETIFQTQAQLALGSFQPLWRRRLFSGGWIGCAGSLVEEEGFLRQLPKDAYYLAPITNTRRLPIPETGLTVPVEHLLGSQPLAWETHPIPAGTVANFARLVLPSRTPPTAQSPRGLLLRQEDHGPIHCALTNAPEEVPVRELARVSGLLHGVAQSLGQVPSELGLDRCQHRSWTTWHRHLRLVGLAQLFGLRRQPHPDPFPRLL